MAGGVPVTRMPRPEPCIDGADFVITSIRVGGTEPARARRGDGDRARRGRPGDGRPGRLRDGGAHHPADGRVRAAHRAAGAATRGSSTSPTRSASSRRRCTSTATPAIIGICDTPTEIFEDAAHALGLPPAACDYDYFGLNHLGWLREVYLQGEPQMHGSGTTTRGWRPPIARRSSSRRGCASCGCCRPSISTTTTGPSRARPPAARGHQPRRKPSPR